MIGRAGDLGRLGTVTWLPSSVDEEVICLDLRADPRDQLAETNEADNATSVAIQIDGTKVRQINSAPCR